MTKENHKIYRAITKELSQEQRQYKKEFIWNCKNRAYKDYWYKTPKDCLENFELDTDEETTAREQWFLRWYELAMKMFDKSFLYLNQ